MRRAFTLIDVLVTLAVMAVLLSILMPSLNSVRETARQVICRSNVRQLGIGLQQYADANEDRLPPSIYLDVESGKPWETMTLRIEEVASWDGLGLLFAEEYMPAPPIFYCPSHRGANPYRQFESIWKGETGTIVGNFQYRGRGPIGHGPASALATTNRFSGMRSGTALIVDGLRTRSDFNHQIGANLFRADNSVGWFSDRDGEVVAMLPKEGDTPPPAAQVDQLWLEFDAP